MNCHSFHCFVYFVIVLTDRIDNFSLYNILNCHANFFERIHCRKDTNIDNISVVVDCPSSLSDISVETVSVSALIKVITDQQASLSSQQACLASQQETIKSLEKLLAQVGDSKRDDVKLFIISNRCQSLILNFYTHFIPTVFQGLLLIFTH